MKSSKKDKANKKKNKKPIVKKEKKRKIGTRIYPPMTGYNPIPSVVYTDDTLVRRNEYLLAICEISGSMEGNELESLKDATEQDTGNLTYEENFDRYYNFNTEND
jgi:hypothetical protein